MKIIIALIVCASANAATFYISQAGGVFSGGTVCNGQTAVSVATFNAATASAGDINYLCGALTTAPKVTGSGSAGNVISYIWDTAARITVPFGQMINLNGAKHNILFDGGIPCGPGTSCDTIEAANQTGYATGQAGIIEATANGSALANQNAGTQGFFGCNACHDIEVRNLIIRNLYVHSLPSDGTSTADNGTFFFQCSASNSGCDAGTILLHDMTVHDLGNTISIQKTVTGAVTVNVYNIDFYHNNWAMENSGDGTRTMNFHDNHIHDTSNWDTTIPGGPCGATSCFHHNGVHNFTNTASDSVATNVYNNLSDGDWGNCCTTKTLLFVEFSQPNNYSVFNNVCLQKAGNTAPCLSLGATTGLLANNTMIGTTSSGNVAAINIGGSGFTIENNVVSGYGQFIVVSNPTTITAMDYNQWGTTQGSGNAPWVWNGTSENTFAAWKAACSCDSHTTQQSNVMVSALGVPLAGSPLIGAGINLTSLGVSALDSDINSFPRPSVAAWDIGAYVYQAPASGGAVASGGYFAGAVVH